MMDRRQFLLTAAAVPLVSVTKPKEPTSSISEPVQGCEIVYGYDEADDYCWARVTTLKNGQEYHVLVRRYGDKQFTEAEVRSIMARYHGIHI